mmetsp:Transcript_10834/g.33579  ORF Transcript_10834/g.33579 Transcript_10834/m.33579 type:complete len:229 (+) Transcript_10834:179-865(+)
MVPPRVPTANARGSPPSSCAWPGQYTGATHVMFCASATAAAMLLAASSSPKFSYAVDTTDRRPVRDTTATALGPTNQMPRTSSAPFAASSGSSQHSVSPPLQNAGATAPGPAGTICGGPSSASASTNPTPNNPPSSLSATAHRASALTHAATSALSKSHWSRGPSERPGKNGSFFLTAGRTAAVVLLVGTNRKMPSRAPTRKSTPPAASGGNQGTAKRMTEPVTSAAA